MRTTFSSHSYAGPTAAPTPAPDQHHCRRLPGPPGFSQGAFRRRRRRRPGRITGVIGSAPSSSLVGCTARRLALPITCYYTEGREAVAGDLRGVAPPLRLSTHAGGKPPTPPTSTSITLQDQQVARTTTTEPPHPETPASLRVTPAGASTARPSHAPAPPYHPTAKTRRRVTLRTPGRPVAGTPRRRRLCLFLCPPLTTPAPERPSPHSRPCLFMFRDKTGAGHASPSSPDGGRRDRYHSSRRRRRIAPGPRRRTQIRTQSRSEPRKNRTRYTTPPDAIPRHPQPPAAAAKALEADRSSRTATTSPPGDIAGSCTTLAVALVSVTASVPPVTTAAPKRTRRSPPRVLFLECAGSCSCARPLRAPAPGPTIDADQEPAPRPGVPVATGLRRMSARPPDHSGQPPHAGEIAKEQCSSFAKTQPAPHPASALILA